MTSGELLQVFTVAGLVAREHGSEVRIETCPRCGNDRWNMEANAARAVFHCWSCRAGGPLAVLLREVTGHEFHITPTAERKTRTQVVAPVATFRHQPARDVYSASAYLTRRGITPAVATEFGLVVCTETNHQLSGRIAVPLRDYWSGALVGWLGRAYIASMKPKYISTMSAAQITGWRARGHHVVLVEGPFDGIAVNRAGYTAAVLGGKSSVDLLDWAGRLPSETVVHILLDSDAALQASRLYWQLRPILQARVQLNALPGGAKDPGELSPDDVASIIGEPVRHGGITYRES